MVKYKISKLDLIIEKVYDDDNNYYINLRSDLAHLVDCFKPFDNPKRAKEYYREEIKKMLEDI